jgi:hypothetical protein
MCQANAIVLIPEKAKYRLLFKMGNTKNIKILTMNLSIKIVNFFHI